MTNSRQSASAIALIINAVLIILGTANAGSFSGHIYDASTGWPIPCAEVIIGNNFISNAAIVATDSAGHYLSPTIADLTDYTLLASSPGYESITLLMQTPHAGADLYLSKPDSGFLAETLNQGLALYQLNDGVSQRAGGEVVEFDFPNIDADNALIDSLLSSIGTDSDRQRLIPSSGSNARWSGNGCRPTPDTSTPTPEIRKFRLPGIS